MTTFSDADKQWLESTFNEIFDKKITELQNTIDKIKKDYDLVVSENIALRDELKSAKIEHDDLEQYGRRYAIRLEGLEFSDGESNEQLQQKIITELGKLSIKIEDSDIQRLHRSSKLKQVKIDKHSTATYPAKQCLIKFTNWRAREKFKKFNKNNKASKLRVYNDLTSRRVGLLAEARRRIAEGFRKLGYNDERVRELPDAENIFAFVDINSNLQIRCRGEIYTFNDEDRLRDILKTYAFPTIRRSTWGSDNELNFNDRMDAEAARREFNLNLQSSHNRVLRSSSVASK